MNTNDRTSPAPALLRAALLLILALALGWYLFPAAFSRIGRAEAAPRPITARGDLDPEEKINIDIFET
ncbi:MAG TPA: hypothetical protein VFS24_09310, partial [Steroidobacteraceae bacterium]|nr:hypothetical protein [Steroidobacteraceae bacterium]